MIKEVKNIQRPFQVSLKEHSDFFHQVGFGDKRGQSQEKAEEYQYGEGDVVYELHRILFCLKPWQAFQGEFLGDLGCCFFNGTAIGNNNWNIVVQKYLIGLIEFVAAGAEFGIGTPFITFLPDKVKCFRGGGQADGP